MARVEVRGEVLIVSLSWWERLLAVRQSFTVPLSHVTDATVDSAAGSEPKGIRAPGTWLPRLLTLGTYRRNGARTFWVTTHGSHPLIVSLVGSSFDRLVIDVPDPYGTADSINRARASL